MDAPKVELARTELDFLCRLLLDLQERVGAADADADADADGRDETIAALELALALLRWDGHEPLPHDAQVGLGAAVQLTLGPDAMCAYRQWRAERRRGLAALPVTH